MKITRTLAGAATALTVAALAAAGFLPSAHAAQAGLPGASPMLTRAPYLTDLTQTSVQVNWATAGQGTGSVGYGPAGAPTTPPPPPPPPPEQKTFGGERGAPGGGGRGWGGPPPGGVPPAPGVP